MLKPPLEAGQDPRKALRRHHERGPARHFTYDDIGAALGIAGASVKSDPKLRAMVRAKDLRGIAHEILRREPR